MSNNRRNLFGPGLLLFFALALASGIGWAKAQSISERTHRQLSRVHELMDRQRYPEALSALDKMGTRTKRKSYEKALLLQTYGYLYARMEQYGKAIDSLAACLLQNKLPKPVAAKTMYTLAQLQMTAGRYPAAIDSLTQWFKLVDQTTPEGHALAGAAYAQVGNNRLAVEHLNKAIALAVVPEQMWYRQLLAVYYDSGEYPKALALLQEMVVRFPGSSDYWLQLSGVYRTIEQHPQALGTLETAYDLGLLTQEEELLNLVQYYLYMGIPHESGQLLATELEQTRITPNRKNWRLLIDIWLLAKEDELALSAIDRVLQLWDDDDLRIRQAELLAARGDWAAVVETTGFALENPKLAARGQAYLLKGIGHYQLRQTVLALRCFQKAGEDAKTSAQAQSWISYLSAAQRLAAGDEGIRLSQRQH